MTLTRMVAAGIALAAGSIAISQTPLGQFSSVRAGAFFPTNGSSGMWLAAGIDTKLIGFKVPGIPLGASIEPSIDYYQKNGTRNIPVLLNVRLSFGKTSFAAGAGVGFSRVSGGESADFNAEFSARTALSSGPFPLFLEGRYYHSSRGAVQGVGVMLGLRF